MSLPHHLLHPVTPLWHLLTNSGLVLSYCHTTHCTHINFITPVWITSVLAQSSACTHTQTFSSPDSVPHWQYYFPHISCNSPHILHLKYNSSHILWCSDSDPVLIHYVILLHVITLTYPLSMTSHPHSHQYCCVLFCSSIKSCLHVCIWHVWISTCVTIVYLTYQLLVTIGLNSDLQTPHMQTLAMCLTLPHLPLGSSNLGLWHSALHEILGLC